MVSDSLTYISRAEVSRLRKKIKSPILRATVLANVFRLNALSMIMEAGSGHVGSSFSAMDIVTWLWLEEMQHPNDDTRLNSDVYFSSKGHDAPGLYAVMIGIGKIGESFTHRLRRINGLPGHPDVQTPFVAANTGSLGMGLAKARGMAGARRLTKKSGRLFVLLGDGELQEGQNWESLQPIANDGFSEITAIIDFNKIQSDAYVKNVSDLGNLEAKFKAFGWEVFRIDGHNMREIKNVFQKTKNSIGKPKVIIADTMKGKGVSFMQKVASDGFYKFHSGAPLPELYKKAAEEIISNLESALRPLGLSISIQQKIPLPSRALSPRAERLVSAYGDELVKLAQKHSDIVALDADLVLDTGLVSYSKAFPDRHVEVGIAEQYMTSMAGGYALKGMLPVVHSFECFLSTHANAQIYNNATERTKIIYVASLAGVLPATPGHSHQSVRGISLVGSIPGLTMIEPSNEKEARMAIRFAVEKNKESTYIRLITIPLELPYALPADYVLKRGVGVGIRQGKDIAIIAYGPTLLKEAFLASGILENNGLKVAVFNMPWLNVVDERWFRKTFQEFKNIITLDDHYIRLGLGDQIAAMIARSGLKIKILSLGLTEIPVCGTPAEVLAHHGLDASSISKNVKAFLTL
ncbi:MAG TPA: transketolase C-terminal domain-containing protein [Candidatus Paceibacterota bacterium]